MKPRDCLFDRLGWEMGGANKLEDVGEEAEGTVVVMLDMSRCQGKGRTYLRSTAGRWLARKLDIDEINLELAVGLDTNE